MKMGFLASFDCLRAAAKSAARYVQCTFPSSRGLFGFFDFESFVAECIVAVFFFRVFLLILFPIRKSKNEGGKGVGGSEKVLTTDYSSEGALRWEIGGLRRKRICPG